MFAAPPTPIGFSLNMAVFDVPSGIPWVPNEPMFPLEWHWQLLVELPLMGTMMPVWAAIEAGPPRLAA
jgi:hypothetical protein